MLLPEGNRNIQIGLEHHQPVMTVPNIRLEYSLPIIRGRSQDGSYVAIQVHGIALQDHATVGYLIGCAQKVAHPSLIRESTHGGAGPN